MPLQFGIKHLLAATLVVGVTTAAAPNLSAMMPEYPTSIYWITSIGAGVLTRWIGWRICWPPGSVGRHALAFFLATLDCAAMMVVLSYEHSGTQLVRDIRDGLGAANLRNHDCGNHRMRILVARMLAHR